MLRIVLMETAGETATLRLEGRVIGPWVDEVRRSCDSILTRGGRLVLDFSDVWFIDRDGVLLFRDLRTRRVVFRNCPPFVAEQLKG
jgi:hypothetical protein